MVFSYTQENKRTEALEGHLLVFFFFNYNLLLITYHMNLLLITYYLLLIFNMYALSLDRRCWRHTIFRS